jgi:hypothetical protein
MWALKQAVFSAARNAFKLSETSADNGSEEILPWTSVPICTRRKYSGRRRPKQ